MESEELIRTIMAEVMANLDKDAVTFAKKEPATAAAAPRRSTSGAVTKDQYPLGDNVPDRIRTPTGKSLADCTFEGVMSGQIKAEDMRISPETLEMQAQVADSVGRTTLATNFRRASELIAVPDDNLLATYDALRPYRSTKKELYDLADELEREYQCSVNAAFIREAADVYEARGRLRVD